MIITEKEKVFAYGVIVDFSEKMLTHLVSDEKGLYLVKDANDIYSGKRFDNFRALLDGSEMLNDFKRSFLKKSSNNEVGSNDWELKMFILLESDYFCSILDEITTEWIKTVPNEMYAELEELYGSNETVNYLLNKTIAMKTIDKREAYFAVDEGEKIYLVYDPDGEIKKSGKTDFSAVSPGVWAFHDWEEVLIENLPVIDYTLNNHGFRDTGLTPAELYYIERPLNEKRFKVFEAPDSTSYHFAIYDTKTESYLRDELGDMYADDDARALFQKAKKLNQSGWLSWI